MSLNGIRHCTSCGREFESKPGRIERLCPECYWAQKEQSGANSFSAKLFPSVNAAANGFNKPFYMVVLRGGYDHRAELKEAGFLFTGLETRTYAFLIDLLRQGTTSQKYWIKTLAEPEIQAEAERLRAWGGKVELPSEYDIQMCQSVLTDYQEKIVASRKRTIEQKAKLGPKPQFEDQIKSLIGTKAWNHKVYGKKDDYYIFLDNAKVQISNAYAASIFHTVKLRNDWEEEMQKIEKGRALNIQKSRRRASDKPAEFNTQQAKQIRMAEESGLPQDQIDLIANPSLSGNQMREVRLGAEHGLAPEALRLFSRPAFSAEKMTVLRESLEQGIPVSTVQTFAIPSLTREEMDQCRKSYLSRKTK